MHAYIVTLFFALEHCSYNTHQLKKSRIINAYTYITTYVHIPIYVYVHVHTHACTYIRSYACITYVYTYACTVRVKISNAL